MPTIARISQDRLRPSVRAQPLPYPVRLVACCLLSSAVALVFACRGGSQSISNQTRLSISHAPAAFADEWSDAGLTGMPSGSLNGLSVKYAALYCDGSLSTARSAESQLSK